MAMKMKTFRAPTMRAAMDQIKETFGPEAVILTSREIRSGANPLVELVAAMDGSPQSKFDAAQLVKKAKPNPEDVQSLVSELAQVRRELRHLRSQRVLDVQATQQWDLLVHELRAVSKAMGINGGTPQSYEALVMRLVGSGVDLTLARTLVERAASTTDDLRECTQHIGEEIRNAFRPAAPLWDSRRRTIAAMVGPTGVGKTTTLAKIAAQAAVKKGRKVAVVAADTYRISGVEQVSTYCDLLGVPWAMATGPGELAHAVQRFSDMDLVLVDTAGQNPWKDDLLGELETFMGTVPVERHLCVSANTRGADLSEMVQRYGQGGIRSLIVTKVDEARSLGGVLSTVWGNDFQIAHITTGQQVPDDIEQPDAAWLSQAVLG